MKTFKNYWALMLVTALILFIGTFTYIDSLKAAVPEDNTDDRVSWSKWQEIGMLTNCNGAGLDSTVNCGDVRVEGYNALTLEIRYDRDAGDGYEFYLETCHEGYAAADCGDATDWHRVAVLHPSPAGVALYPEPIFRDVSVDEQTTITIGINYKRVRLGGVTGKGSATSSDLLYINARISWLQAL